MKTNHKRRRRRGETDRDRERGRDTERVRDSQPASQRQTETETETETDRETERERERETETETESSRLQVEGLGWRLGMGRGVAELKGRLLTRVPAHFLSTSTFSFFFHLPRDLLNRRPVSYNLLAFSAQGSLRVGRLLSDNCMLGHTHSESQAPPPRKHLCP